MSRAARPTAISLDAELPIQAPVEEPIINSPFEEPRRHWAYTKEGRANKIDGRRDAAYFWTTQRVMTGQQSLEGIGSDYGSEPLALVNALRKDVKRWRESGYENATKTTRRLFEHWRDEVRKERGARRFFFCQLEAVETVVYLNEILASGRRTRWKAEVSAEDFVALIAGRKPPLAAGMSDSFFPTLRDGELTRLGCKMATGSGKTVVMAMLLAWAFCNRGATPGDTRFPSAALVCCPNLTVKERLQVLRTDGDPEKSYFVQFDIVPPMLRGHLQAGRVLVTNWHAFAPESEHAENGKTHAVVNKGEEGADAFARRVLRELYGRGELLVLNDEAHHAYRPAPPEKAVRVPKKKKDAEAAFGEASEEDNAEATVWVEGLDKLKAAVGVKCCVDLSATPFYLAGSGYVEGSPFPWLVSDFGLVDAIESGITKIPRIPVADTTGRPDPQFFKLWEDIRRKLKAQGDANFDRGKPKPEPAWREAQAAFSTLASQWQQRFAQHGVARPGQNFIPPVLIVVCDNTDLAQVVFEQISGEHVEEIEETDDDGKTSVRRERRFNVAGVQFPDLANTPEKTVTLRIDSKLLAEADAGGANGGRLKEAERLRELIANVGKAGTVGEHVRCVVSVQMLTEGWDASNVTQILGLRAFGSQLLCEQVVGRGLRRISYDVEKDANGEERLHPEYVDVYGIPFSLIPFKGRETKAPPPDDTPVSRVAALPARTAFELRFPNVDGYVLELRQHKIRCDVAAVEALEIRPTTVPTLVFVQPQVGIKDGAGVLMSGTFETVQQTRTEFYRQHHFQTVLFEITRRLVTRLTESQGGAAAKLKNYARHQLFPQVLAIVENYAERRVRWNNCDRRELALEIYSQRLIGLLADAIEPDAEQGEPPLLPVINRFKPSGTTADVSFTTKRPCHPTMKSHVDAVVLDTDTWERSVAFQLEASQAVAFYARNDHLGLEVPYEFFGVAHKFLPDFVVRLANGANLLLEVKGFEGEEELAKHQAAKRWVSAVNNYGRMGRWLFHVCKNPDTLRTEVEWLNGQGKKGTTDGHGCTRKGKMQRRGGAELGGVGDFPANRP